MGLLFVGQPGHAGHTVLKRLKISGAFWAKKKPAAEAAPALKGAGCKMTEEAESIEETAQGEEERNDPLQDERTAFLPGSARVDATLFAQPSSA